MMISVTLLMLNPGAISIQSGNEADCGSTTDTRTESSRATWDSTIVIDKNYIVQSGENLLIESGAKIFVEDDMGIFVEGTLTVSGTAAAPVIFSGAGSAAKWNGIQFNDTANTLGSSISYTKISDAKTAVAYQSGSVSISDVELSNNDVAVSMYLSSGSIRDTTFDSNKIGISADSSNLQISNSTINSSSTNDIAVKNNALLKLINVIFYENKFNI